MATPMVDVKYDEELVKRIQELFINKIVPENFLLTIHKYNENVLTMADIQRLRKMLDHKPSIDVNYELLTTLKNYNGWFEAILNVCRDSEVKQEFLVNDFNIIKRKLDITWQPTKAQNAELEFKFGNLSLASDEASEADGGAVCASPARTSLIKTEDQTQQGWTMKNGSGHCDIPLTSEKFKDIHIAGKLLETRMQVKGFNSSFDEACTDKVAPATFEITENLDENWMRKCDICNVTLTSAPNAKQHFDGRKHKNAKALSVNVKATKDPPSLGPNGKISSINEHGVGQCYLCGVHLTSNENANQHLTGRKHRNKCAEYGLQ